MLKFEKKKHLKIMTFGTRLKFEKKKHL